MEKRSALALKVKRNVFVNECVRRLRNCSLELPWSEKANYLTNYMARLKIAGYNQQFRVGVLRQAVARYNGMVQAHRAGKQPMYRSKHWVKENRNVAGPGAGGGKRKNTDWVSKGGYDTVMFVPATPRSELADLWKKDLEKFGEPFKVKVVEDGGKTIKSEFQKSNPRKKIGCEERDCLACINGRGVGGDCRRPNIGYEVKCGECAMSVLYIGETSKSMYVRGLGHIRDYQSKRHDSPLWRHALDAHNGRLDVAYSKKLIKCFRDPLTRQCNESVRIQRSDADILLNGKAEWHGPATVRLQIDV